MQKLNPIPEAYSETVFSLNAFKKEKPMNNQRNIKIVIIINNIYCKIYATALIRPPTTVLLEEIQTLFFHFWL